MSCNPLKQLSKNFQLGEFLRSEQAKAKTELSKKQMNPPIEVINALAYLATNTLQPIRDKFGFRIAITSGYRCAELNEKVCGMPNSQHLVGEAADCVVDPLFLTNDQTINVRNFVREKVKEITSKDLRADVNGNFYLFAFACIYLNDLDIDQVIHEWGPCPGQPDWCHMSASESKNKREILRIKSNGQREILTLEKALALGV